MRTELSICCVHALYWHLETTMYFYCLLSQCGIHTCVRKCLKVKGSISENVMKNWMSETYKICLWIKSILIVTYNFCANFIVFLSQIFYTSNYKSNHIFYIHFLLRITSGIHSESGDKTSKTCCIYSVYIWMFTFRA